MSLKPHPNPDPNAKVKPKTKKPVRAKKSNIDEELLIEELSNNVDEWIENRLSITYQPPVVNDAYIKAAFPPPPTWKDIVQSKEQQWIQFSMLVHWLMNADMEHCLTGWAGPHDPLYRDPDKLEIERGPYQDDDYQEIGAIELDGVVLVFYEDPGDGYRSYLGQVLVWPGQTLKTRLPNVPVAFIPSTSSDSWDDPSRNDPKDPTLLDMVSRYADEPVLIFGTSYPDSYYPHARFYMNPSVMGQVVAPLSENHLLHQEVGSVDIAPTSVKKKKM